jgi:hypothetical protein
MQILILGFDSNQPSRYLSRVKEQLKDVAQLEWDDSGESIAEDPFYRCV